MPSIYSGPSDKFAQVEYPFGGLRVTPSPLGYGKTAEKAYGNLGHYTVAAATGTIAATLAADALLFAIRWTSTTKKLVLLELDVSLVGLTAFPTDQQLRLSLRRGTAYTGASSGGTDLASLVQKMDTGMAATSVADIRIASTGALTAGTVTAGGPIDLAAGTANDLNVAAGTAMNVEVQPRLSWRANIHQGCHPIVLNANEGILVRNDVLWGATGTAAVVVRAKWFEAESVFDTMGNPV